MSHQHPRTLAAGDLDTPGKRLRFLRLAKGWKQGDLARRVHTSQPAVSQWENDLWLPSEHMQKLLAEELGATRLFLFGERAA